MDDRTITLRIRLASGAAAWALVASAGLGAQALAQEADPETVAETVAEEDDAVLETVVVSGFRSSLESAIANKRNADTIIESITAEDIGRLPDISIAEALARLPGIASQRTNGQSSAINIRGLSQNLTFTTLNGREQVTPNGNRSIEFEQFPSELISGADIFKSPKASLIEGGVGGTVELKTVRPLDIGEDYRLNFNVRGSFNDRADEIFSANEFGYRVSASYVGKFANDTLGVALGYARLEQPDVSTRFVGFDFGGPDGPDCAFIDNNGDGVDDLISFGFVAEEQGGYETRDG
ncbi:MAG: TonB-dependent receptor plug domain-containing protein, partial [Pseudomonadota bacterium]